MKYFVLKLSDEIDLDKLIMELTKLKLLNLKTKKFNAFLIMNIAEIILNCIIDRR
jgi:hypothetical protein